MMVVRAPETAVGGPRLGSRRRFPRHLLRLAYLGPHHGPALSNPPYPGQPLQSFTKLERQGAEYDL